MQRTQVTWESLFVVHHSSLATLVQTATLFLMLLWSSPVHATALQLKHLTPTCVLSPRSPFWKLRNPLFQGATRIWQVTGWQKSNVFLDHPMIVYPKNQQTQRFYGMNFRFYEHWPRMRHKLIRSYSLFMYPLKADWEKMIHLSTLL